MQLSISGTTLAGIALVLSSVTSSTAWLKQCLGVASLLCMFQQKLSTINSSLSNYQLARNCLINCSVSEIINWYWSIVVYLFNTIQYQIIWNISSNYQWWEVVEDFITGNRPMARNLAYDVLLVPEVWWLWKSTCQCMLSLHTGKRHKEWIKMNENMLTCWQKICQFHFSFIFFVANVFLRNLQLAISHWFPLGSGMLLEDLLEFLEKGLGEDATGRSRGSRSWAV